jgi:pantoate--beta-alanine ligase
VTTVVAKLFGIVQPDRAYFGEKDGQQLRVIRRMTQDLLLPIEIVACPTVREPDGLARSSRNVYLTAEERAQAPALHAGLAAAAEAFSAGERDADRLRALVREHIEAQPLAEIDYVSLADSETLEELAGAVERAALLSLAVRFSGARLIDNVTLRP